MRVLLIDDHALFRAGLRFILADLDPNIEFLEADCCAAALAQASKQVDLILLDLQMPDTAGESAVIGTVLSSFENARLVVVSSEENPRAITGAIDHGACGFIPKTSAPEILISALKLIIAGGVYIPLQVIRATQKIADPPKAPSAVALGGLTGRVHDVFELAVQGKSNKVIARELDISEGTVKAHMSTAFRILGVRNRTEAVFAVAARSQ